MNDKDVLMLRVLASADGHGLDVEDRLMKLTGRRFPMLGTCYARLRALEAHGFLRSYESEPMPARGDRPRIYYAITEKGRQAIKEAETP